MSLNSSFIAKFNEICRTCLKGGQLLTYLYDEENNINLVNKLKSCTALQFDKNDRMPNKICPTCTEELLQAYNFINKCQISEATLKKYINNEYSVTKIEDDLDIEEPIKMETFHEDEASVDETFNTSEISIKDEFLEMVFAENTKKRKFEDSFFDCSVDLSCKKKRDNDLLYPMGSNNTFSGAESVDDVAAPARKTRSEMGKENFAQIPKKKRGSYAPIRKRRTFCCPICPKKTKNNVVGLLTHLQSHTELLNKDLTLKETSNNRCQICWTTITEPENLLEHYKMHLTSNKCEYCCKIFKTGNLRKHQLEKHSGSHPYICELCNKKIPDAHALQEHKSQQHCPDKLHRCEICFYTFDNAVELKSHGGVHICAPFKCQSCANVFEDAHELIAHKIEQKCGKFYLCNECPEIFQKITVKKLHKHV